MSRQKPQAETLRKHPEEYREDLNPNAMAGQNIGLGETQAAKNAPNAHDLKNVHQRLRDLPDDELLQLRVLPEGSRLEQDATYLDLKNLAQGEITALGNMSAGADNWYIAKKDVHFNLWNYLIGVDNIERLTTTRDKFIDKDRNSAQQNQAKAK
jgi:hypothetical protein